VQTNTFALVVQGWIEKSFPTVPKFVGRLKPDGEFEAVLRAPRGSRAGYLVVHTSRGDLWVRFNPPHMSYPVDSRREMTSIVRHLVAERALFLVTYRGDAWSGTTLVRRNVVPTLRRGEVAHIVSWSGRFDKTLGLDHTKHHNAGKRPQPTPQASSASKKQSAAAQRQRRTP